VKYGGAGPARRPSFISPVSREPGYPNAGQLKKTSPFQPLRAQEDFQKLLVDPETKGSKP
jgi:hypothetical protein